MQTRLHVIPLLISVLVGAFVASGHSIILPRPGAIGELCVMSNIMILCPIFGQPVPTGITTDMIILETLTFDLSMQCPACRKTHKWKRRDAWVDDQGNRAGAPITKRPPS